MVILILDVQQENSMSYSYLHIQLKNINLCIITLQELTHSSVAIKNKIRSNKVIFLLFTNLRQNVFSIYQGSL